MDKELLIRKIKEQIARTPKDFSPYDDLFSFIRSEEIDLKQGLTYSRDLRAQVDKAIKYYDGIDIERFIDLSKRTLLFEAPHRFDSYMRYLEINRPPQERFYTPRRSVLKSVVNDIQDLIDGVIDEYFLQTPPRVGKTTLIMFLLTMIMGKNSERSNLYSAFSDIITGAMYSGVNEVISDNYTYTWGTIFPKAKIVQTNAKNETINIDRIKRYPSLTCRSLYGTLNGACDCNGYLISDDLIGGIEEALNKDRLRSAWAKVDNNLIPRAKESAKLMWVGTRWSIIDPAGLRMELLQNNPNYANRRVRIRKIPALDPQTDESNFHYKYNVGFSTDYYRQRRASFEQNNDMASWNAQYQQEPIERDGALFQPDEMKYYNGELPGGEPDRVFMAVDPAFGGGDFVSAPVIYQYGEEGYVHDVVFDPGDKKITEPRIVDLILRNNVKTARFEANNGGESYKDDIEKELKNRNYRLNITSKNAPTTKRKEMRIFEKAPEIRELYFRENGKRSKDYSLFMQNLFAFKLIGKNKNDDAPDSLAMAVEIMNGSGNAVEVIPRPI